MKKAFENKTLNLKGSPKNGSGINGTKATISKALKRRAQSLINDGTIEAQSRAVIRYALETNDPWLPELVRRADAGEPLLDEAGFLLRSAKISLLEM